MSLLGVGLNSQQQVSIIVAASASRAKLLGGKESGSKD
jgi:hypothetical protein